MAGRKFFFIESKSFEVLLDGSNSRLQLIERGKNRMSNITWGREGAKWFCSTMAKVVSLPMDKLLREDGTVFVFQKNRNDRGRFLTVMTYGDLRHKGHVVVPVGRDMWGWRKLAQVLSELVTPMKFVTSGKSRPAESYRSRNSWDNVTFKDAVIAGKVDAKMAGSDHVGYGKIECNLSCSDSQHVEINFKLILSMNTAGKWEAKWVGSPHITQNMFRPRQDPKQAQVCVPRLGEKEKKKDGLL